MARAAVHRRLTWQAATVAQVTDETPVARTIMLEVPRWPGHRAGQHLDIRLTAEDGYTAERSYSIATAPGEPVAITVERIEDGEVSPYLTQELRPGDLLELRGPIGGYFVWDATCPSPLLLVAGGSGIVPLRSILRHRQRSAATAAARLLYSTRSLPDTIYRGELGGWGEGVSVIQTLTRSQPPGWTGHTGRAGAALLAEAAWPVSAGPLAFVCGPTAFVESIADGLIALGYPAGRVKTERFGTTGAP